jgi:hypothetical protein
MSTRIRIADLSLALTPGLTGVQLCRLRNAAAHGNALAEQAATDDIIQARAALSYGRPIAAVTDTENAETLLLNAEQACSIQYPEAALTASFLQRSPARLECRGDIGALYRNHRPRLRGN